MTEIQQTAKRVLSLLDLTSLNDNDTEAEIRTLCDNAVSKHGTVAAVCVWPHFVKLASELLIDSPVKVAAVANFPEGSTDIESSVKTCKEIIKNGGDEVDVVFPYKSFLTGNKTIGAKLISACKDACGNKTLKVILETGSLKEKELIQEASKIALDNGADFIKTSTGKVEVSATLESAKAMLDVLKANQPSAGFKAAGGIKDIQTASDYLALADKIMGNNWVSADTFRFGASGILNNLLIILNNGDESNAKTVEGY